MLLSSLGCTTSSLQQQPDLMAQRCPALHLDLIRLCPQLIKPHLHTSRLSMVTPAKDCYATSGCHCLTVLMIVSLCRVSLGKLSSDGRGSSVGWQQE